MAKEEILSEACSTDPLFGLPELLRLSLVAACWPVMEPPTNAPEFTSAIIACQRFRLLLFSVLA
jgi:hypothetical protein